MGPPGESFRSLEYQFKNQLDRQSEEKTSLSELTDRTLSVIEKENAPRTALLQVPEATWGFSVMKFIVEVSLRSFSSNVKELDERGYFHPEQRAQAAQRLQIERLFQEAQRDPSALKRLADVLKGSGVFADYEDRFFALVNRAG